MGVRLLLHAPDTAKQIAKYLRKLARDVEKDGHLLSYISIHDREVKLTKRLRARRVDMKLELPR